MAECIQNNVFQKDLDFALNGKKIVKSVQNRLNNYANFILKNNQGGFNGNQNGKEGIYTNKNEFYIKFINISQSFGIKIEVGTSK